MFLFRFTIIQVLVLFVDIFAGLTSNNNLNASTVSHHEIDISITLPDSLTCTVRKGWLNATICYRRGECNDRGPDCEDKDVMLSGDPVPFENLTSDTTYCFVVTLSSVNSSLVLSRQFMTNKDTSLTTDHSLITTGTSLSLKPNVRPSH